MVWRKGALVLTGTALSLGIALPLAAQQTTAQPQLMAQIGSDDDVGLPESSGQTEEEPLIIDQDRILNDDTGLPEGGDAADDTGLPDAGRVLTDNVIVIDGRVYQYNPDALEGNILLNDLTPLDEGNDGDISPEVPDVPGPDTTPDDDGFVTYPPADSVRDLEPEDILE